MSNFADIILLVKTTIQNLVGFSYSCYLIVTAQYSSSVMAPDLSLEHLIHLAGIFLECVLLTVS